MVGCAHRGRGTLARLRAAWKLYLVLLPIYVLVGLFLYYPDLNGLYHAFTDWRPGVEGINSPFVGLANFRTLLNDTYFWKSFGNVVQLFIFSVTLPWFFPFLAAELIMTLSSQRARRIFRILLLIPMAFPLAVNILLWQFIFDPQIGLLNSILGDIGLGAWQQNWLGNPHIALYSLMLIGFPYIVGLPFLILGAALESISPDIFAAAALDGAGRFRRALYIDLPLLSAQFKLLLVLSVIANVQGGVVQALLTNGGPAFATMTPALYLITSAFDNGDWGYAAAISAVLFVLTATFSLLSLRLRARARLTAPATATGGM
jgi:raffinose/stachyose/melibiose transport system permease protein